MTSRELRMLVIASFIGAIVSVIVARWFDDQDHGRL